MLQMVLAVLACCACDKAPDRDGSGGMSTSGNAIQPAVAAGGSGGMASTSGTNTGGADGASNGSMEAGSPAASGGGGTGTRNAPATSGSGGAAIDSGTPSAGDASIAPDAGPQSIPPPVTTPYVWGVGIGITDVPAAVKFYKAERRTDEYAFDPSGFWNSQGRGKQFQKFWNTQRTTRRVRRGARVRRALPWAR